MFFSIENYSLNELQWNSNNPESSGDHELQIIKISRLVDVTPKNALKTWKKSYYILKLKYSIVIMFLFTFEV